MTRPSIRSALVVAAIAALACTAPPGGAPSPARMTAADSAARAAIANERALDPRSFPPRSVGVAPFRVSARDTSLDVLGYGIADLLLSDLAVSSQLVVVERLQVDAILRELNRRASGRVDTTSAPRLGRLLGARQIVAGQIAIQPDDRLRLDGRVANTITGSINPAVSNASTLNNVLDAEKQLAFALFDRLQVSLTPAERARVDRRATRSIAALLAYSRGVRDEIGGDFPAAMREYQDAVRRDPAFRQAGARLNDVSSRLAAPAIAALSPLARVTALAADALNRPLIVTPAADPAFTATSRIVTIIITVDIP